MQKKKIPNLRDQFEDVLLYTSGYEKIRDKVDESLLKDPQFCKVVRYMTTCFCQKNRGLLSTLGYDDSDVHTVISMYALRFMAMPYKANSERSRYMFLMRHLSQRFPRFRNMFERKHAMKDVMMIWMDNFDYVPTALVDDSQPDTALAASDDYDVAKAEYARIGDEIKTASTLEERRALRLERWALKLDMQDASARVKAHAAKKRQEKSENDRITRELRLRLKAMPKDQVASKMAYYATIRAVSSDVRETARAFCRANGINYSAWARAYMEQHNFDESEFVL